MTHWGPAHAYLHDVALDDLQVRRMWRALNPALQLQHLRARGRV